MGGVPWLQGTGVVGVQSNLNDMFDTIVATLSDTRLEPDLPALPWALVNMFHRRIDRIERTLDDNELAQRASQRTQDGSEVRSLELEQLIAQGLALIERRDSFELIRDWAAELYGRHTGQLWQPCTGSMVNQPAPGHIRRRARQSILPPATLA